MPGAHWPERCHGLFRGRRRQVRRGARWGSALSGRLRPCGPCSAVHTAWGWAWPLRSPPHRVVWMWGEGGVWTRWSLMRKLSVKPQVLETLGTVSRPRQRTTGWRRRMGSEGTGSQGAQTPSQRAFPSEAEGPPAPEPFRGCPRLRTHRMEPPEPEEGICFYF